LFLFRLYPPVTRKRW